MIIADYTCCAVVMVHGVRECGGAWPDIPINSAKYNSVKRKYLYICSYVPFISVYITGTPYLIVFLVFNPFYQLLTLVKAHIRLPRFVMHQNCDVS